MIYEVFESQRQIAKGTHAYLLLGPHSFGGANVEKLFWWRMNNHGGVSIKFC